MYAKIINNLVDQYPYSIDLLKRENSNVSFSSNIEVDFDTLASFSVFRVFPTAKPSFDISTQKVVEISPVLVNDRWEQAWEVQELSEAERLVVFESKAAEVRALRQRLLMESDWTQFKDIPDSLSQIWQPYRQQLRDVPAQEGFPFSVTWPPAPV